ncbi:Sulfate transporter 3.1 [Heracleum sosnowskyi]|uniref:Sulfate transporter 3.1 n=1 Tax=Heracleum sosnowskyi TaxID=360622 RepID=A0AAD8J9Q7_9APIA|nr:Sulfate transporter 3.1 [Heracleum sosnowskyi]
MGKADYIDQPESLMCFGSVAVPAPQPFLESLKNDLNRKPSFLMILYANLRINPPDLIAGITIASLAIPQGISYAKLANLPPIIGLYSSFVPPLIYAVMGSSRDLAVGTIAVASLMTASMLGNEVNATENPTLYLHLAFTATFFAGIFQASLGILRLGFIVVYLSHATIVGFMGGAATVVSLQQLKGILGLKHFTQSTDLVSVMHQWRWESTVLGGIFLFYLLVARYCSKKRAKLFWMSAMAPLISVVIGSLLVYFTHAEKHGIQVIGNLKKGLNPPSVMDLAFRSEYLATAIKTGIITGVVALAEGIAVGRTFSMFSNYHIDGNKEMISYGMMNIAGSCTFCYITTGPFSRTAVNFNAGCKSAVSNIVMAFPVMLTLLFLTPLFHYTPIVVLSSIIISAMLGLIDYSAALHLWNIDKFDFVVCMTAYFGVVFCSIEIGLILAVLLSVLRLLFLVTRPKTLVLGKIPESKIYRSIDQYPNADNVDGILILKIDAPIFFANSSYLRERILRRINEEEDKLKSSGKSGLKYVILDMGGVADIDTSGTSMLEEVKATTDKRGLKLVVANPGGEVIKKLNNAKFMKKVG